MAGIKIGSAAMIEIGYEGESRTREIIFDAKEWMEKLPGCEPAIVGVRADGVEFTAPDVRKDEEEKTIIWTLTAGETIAGEGEAQILWMDGERIAKKAIMVTMCRASLETEATAPDAPEPTWGQMAIDAMQRAQAAAGKAETALGAVNGAKSEAIAAIEEADAAALEGIAYAKDRALEEIDAAAGTAAGSIMPVEAGEVIAVHDSAEKNMRAVKIYGRTTQSGTPTPDAPVPLVTVGADGNVKVSSCGKNLYNPDMTVFGDPFYNTDGTTQSAASVRVGLIPVEPNTAYTVTAYGNYYIRMAHLDANKVYIRRNTLLGSEEGASVTITTASNAAYIQVAADRSLSKAQIEKGSVATEYEQAAPKTATITTAFGLPGLPVTSGGNYTDANGQQWIADTVEYNADDGTEKWTKRANTLVFDGSEDEGWRVNGGRMRLDVKTVIFPNSASEMPAVMCDKFEAKTANQTYDGQVGISLQGFGGGSGSIFIRYGATADVAEWRNMLAEEPMMCIVALAEPIETQLSAEETAQIAALKTYYPETTVYNDDGAHMEIKYVADTKNYIDKKIEAIAAAMLAKI